jgi:hypothetical protein
VGTPVGFVLSLLGVILNKGRRAGAVGLAISVILLLWFGFTAFC